jgi:hypothetical protein
LLDAHQESVKEAVAWLEEHTATYREQGFFGVKSKLAAHRQIDETTSDSMVDSR